MNTFENPIIPFHSVESRLSADDDRTFWQVALTTLADEFMLQYHKESRNRDWAMVVGACSHWVRPNQTRWTAAGGFAFPEGYKEFTPEFDWSLILLFRNQEWIPVVK